MVSRGNSRCARCANRRSFTISYAEFLGGNGMRVPVSHPLLIAPRPRQSGQFKHVSLDIAGDRRVACLLVAQAGYVARAELCKVPGDHFDNTGCDRRICLLPDLGSEQRAGAAPAYSVRRGTRVGQRIGDRLSRRGYAGLFDQDCDPRRTPPWRRRIHPGDIRRSRGRGNRRPYRLLRWSEVPTHVHLSGSAFSIGSGPRQWRAANSASCPAS